MIYNFTYWKHFTFASILEYAGVYLIEDNVYTMDRFFIEGEFGLLEFIGVGGKKSGKKIHATFALNINEVITIVTETEPIKWKAIDVK